MRPSAKPGTIATLAAVALTAGVVSPTSLSPVYGPSPAAVESVITDGDRSRIAAAVAKRERKAAKRLAERKVST